MRILIRLLPRLFSRRNANAEKRSISHPRWHSLVPLLDPLGSRAEYGPMNATAPAGLDVVIFGGGAAGLWLLDQLVENGYDALLLETGDLGSGQTPRPSR